MIKTNLSGKAILLNSQLNKGTAFTVEERNVFKLHGLLPYATETMTQQISRAYQQFRAKTSDLEKNLYLNDLYDTNTTLFFALAFKYLEEMLPVIYTPTIGEAVINFGENYLKSQGLIIAWPDRDRIDEILKEYAGKEINVAVVTDGEGVLGIGDQGIGGLKISIGKLMVYTLCGGLNPFKTLPVQLDAGTNNEKLLNDPLYPGWRHKRISNNDYHDFLKLFVEAFQRWLPKTLLHWEDFGRDNAHALLHRYRLVHPSFNDDIQGTGAVTVSAILTGIRKSGLKSEDHKICIFGAGTAGIGIAEQICKALSHEENSDTETVKQRLFLIDKTGLLVKGEPALLSFQEPYAKKASDISSWIVANPENISLSEVIQNARPTILIGCSTQSGAFKEEILKLMYSYCKKPLIMPLSNPTTKAETTPAEILQATEGNALIATGSPFPDLIFNGKAIKVSQCNNALIFPGLGLGMLICNASQLTDSMLLAASRTLSDFILESQHSSSVLPDFSQIREISREIALSVARKAAIENVGKKLTEEELSIALEEILWSPQYSEIEFEA